MEVKVVSREKIAPSSAAVLNEAPPYKLCLFDDMTPLTYMSIVLFYPHFSHQTLAHLKASLSQTLNFYYPFSGRITDRLFVHHFHSGVLFSEAQLNVSMSHYFNLKDVELLNRLVPFQPLRNEAGSPDLPLLAFQANVFACGGMALGTSFCHKVADGATMSNFLSSWAALSRGDPAAVKTPSLSIAAELFPPVEGFVEQHQSKIDQVWFMTEANYVTKTFVFDATSIAALIEKAKREGVPAAPTRNEAVSCFLWERITQASRAVSGDRGRLSGSIQAVNLRPRMSKLRPELSQTLANATGNLVWIALALSFDLCDENASAEAVEFAGCARQLRQAMEVFDSEFIRPVMESKDGSSEVMSQLEDMLAMEPAEAKPDTVLVTNWKDFYNEVDFGWGKPFWIGANGKTGSVLRDYIIMIESTRFPRGVEAFVSVEDAKMAILETDHHFLEFASLNPDFPTPLI